MLIGTARRWPVEAASSCDGLLDLQIYGDYRAGQMRDFELTNAAVVDSGDLRGARRLASGSVRPGPEHPHMA